MQRIQNPNTVICASSIERILLHFVGKDIMIRRNIEQKRHFFLASLECRYFMDCIFFRRPHGSFGQFSFEIASNHSYQQMKKNENF